MSIIEYLLLLINSTPLKDTTLYHQLVECLVYLIVTQVGITHLIHIISQFMDAPYSTHYVIVLHILHYV